jgi:pilus assembly protein CpaE
VDLLPAGALRPGARIELEDLQQILAFAARRYPLTIVDLSGNWERYSLEAMAQANRILLVTTTDFSALYHSRRNLDTLQEMGMGDKVRVVLNRTTYHTGLDKKAVESILGATPVVSLPNAYHALQEALKDATTVKQRSPFGQGIERLRPEILPASALVVPEGCAASNGRAPSGRFSAIRSVMAGLGSKCLDIQSLDLG